MIGPLDTMIFQRTVKNTSLQQSSPFGYSKGEMKGTAAVLLSCLMSLASVDATSLAKVSASKYNYGWEQVEYNWLPNDQQVDFLKSSPFFDSFPSKQQLENIVKNPAQSVKQSSQYTSRGTSTDDLPTDEELASSYLHDIPSQNLMPPENSVDDLPRISSRNIPYLTLKMKLKIKLPLADRFEETMVSEPKYVTVIDKELNPFQSSNEYPDKTVTESTALVSKNHAPKNLLDTKTDDSGKKVEKLQHSSKMAGGVTETFTKPKIVKTSQPVPVHDDFTADIDNYLNYLKKLQHLVDTMNEVQENILKLNQHYPLTEPKRTEDQVKPSDSDNSESEPAKEDPYAKLYDEIFRASIFPQISPSGLPSISQSSKDRMSEDQVKPSDSDDSESEPAIEEPHAKLYDEIYRASKIPQISLSGLPSISQSSKDRMSEDQVKPSDSDNSESEPAVEEPHAKLYDEIYRASKIHQITPSGLPLISQPSKDRMSEYQVKPSDSDDSESEPAKEDPYAKLYDEIFRAFIFPQISPSGLPLISQPSKDRMSEYQVKPSDSDNSESEPAVEEPHAKLYDEIYRASKIHQITPSGLPLISQPSKDRMSEYQVKPSDSDDSESEPAKEDPYAKLYDEIFRAFIFPQISPSGLPLISQPSKDRMSEYQVKPSDSDDSESEPAKEDPYAKLYDEIFRAFIFPQISPSGLPLISQSSKDRMSEDQVKPSDSDDSESKPAIEEPHAKLYDEIYRASKIPQITPSGLPLISQPSKDRMSEDQVKPSDSDDSESEPAIEEPHAKLYDEIYRASKISQISPSGLPLISQPSKDRMSEDQVKPSDSDDSESEPAKEDPHAKLYDEIFRASKIPQISPSGLPLTSQSSKDRISENEVKPSDSDNSESEPAVEEPHAKLYDEIYRASKISPSGLSTFLSPEGWTTDRFYNVENIKYRK